MLSSVSTFGMRLDDVPPAIPPIKAARERGLINVRWYEGIEFALAASCHYISSCSVSISMSLCCCNPSAALSASSVVQISPRPSYLYRMP
ncbi:hypothetical protein XACLE20_1510005 [Xanthomonas citri pv. citri]|nr:hypothetical protein XACLE20_1510005 [Xanthomonas citri pv. citri]CEH53707.1 hypothetical protein XACLE3_7060005 [Xanthomonas citri pv. citri]